MGYDMFMCGKGPASETYYECTACYHEIDVEKAKASAVPLEGAPCRRESRSCEGVYRTRKTQPTYFRANIRGMPILRDAMDAAGLLDWDYEPEWPEPETPEPKDPDSPEYEAWAETLDTLSEPVRAARTDSEGFVYGQKFCSNDGWRVLPEECLWIAAGLKDLIERMKGEDFEDETARLSDELDVAAEVLGFDAMRRIHGSLSFVEEWARYNRTAAEHGGYRVH